jgi:pilus assembly protein CpaC
MLMNRLLVLFGVVGLMAVLTIPAAAQLPSRQPLRFQVSEPNERLEMVVNTSRIITTEHKIPQVLVENESIVRAQPIAANQVQLSALRTGFTSLTIWDENNREYSVDVIVFGDARELENLLMTEFPEASLRVRPLASSVVISGYAPSIDVVRSVIEMAEDYYPSVINNITVGGVQQVLLHVKVMEVSRTKLRSLGIDWALFSGDDAIISRAAGVVARASLSPPSVINSGRETLAFTVMNGNTSFFAFIEALRQYNMIKILAEPTLVTTSGRPASFSSGGEFPILVPQSFGNLSVEYREFGTRIDFVPLVLGNGRVRLEVRPQVSEIDPTRSVTFDNNTVPGLRTRWADTAVEMNAGETLALAGLIQNQVETENRGLPWLADLPWVGAAFRRVEERNNEVELLIMVTPEFVTALDPHEVPPCGPGQLTTSPGDVDLYWRGYTEVPGCCNDGSCADCQNRVDAAGYMPFNDSPSRMMVKPAVPSASTPVHTTTSSRRPQIPQQPLPPQAVRQPVSQGPPSLIGPIGYDDLQ